MDKMIRTNRLILRKFKKDDAQDLYEYLSDPEVVKYEPYNTKTMEETIKNLDKRIVSDEMIAVELKSNSKLIGNIYIGKAEFESIELGYIFNKNYWNKGYASEACKAIIDALFTKGIHRIFAQCDPNNSSSWKLLESLGVC